MRIVTSEIPSIKKFTKHLIEILSICETGFSLLDDYQPIFRACPRILIFVNSDLLDYFDLNPLLLKSKPFSFFVGKKVLLREIRGYDNVIQLVDDQQNRIEMIDFDPENNVHDAFYEMLGQSQIRENVVLALTYQS